MSLDGICQQGGGHGTRTRNPLRGTSFPMKPLAIRLPSKLLEETSRFPSETHYGDQRKSHVSRRQIIVDGRPLVHSALNSTCYWVQTNRTTPQRISHQALAAAFSVKAVAKPKRLVFFHKVTPSNEQPRNSSALSPRFKTCWRGRTRRFKRS